MSKSPCLADSSPWRCVSELNCPTKSSCFFPSPKRPQPSPLGAQGKLDVSDVCPTGRVRDMCYVEAANGGGDDGVSESSLVTVTSAGGVHVWGVPALEGVSAEGAGAELTVPLLATHSLKVGGGTGHWHHILV